MSGTTAGFVNVRRVTPWGGEENPFTPRLEGAPLVLTLDGRSLGETAGEDRERTEFLCELCHTDFFSGLWTWGGRPLDPALPVAELRPLDTRTDSRAVGLVGQGGFIGGVPAWSSRERLADEDGLTGAAREWFLDYSAATHFSRSASRHLFVTADRRLLDEARGGKRRNYWRRERVISVAGALRLAGQLMLSREKIYEEARANYSRHTSPYTLYFYLGPDLAPARIRLHRWLESAVRQPGPEADALEQAMHDRVVDLLKARDAIARETMRHQNNATLDEILYHLRAAVGSTAALFDSIAVFAQLVLGIDEESSGGAIGISLRRRTFRGLLRKNDAPLLAEAASELKPFMDLIWALRTPIVHRAGLSGSSYVQVDLGAVTESRVTFSAEQAAALDAVRAVRRESAAEWGRSDFAHQAMVEPQAFSNRFSLLAICASDRLVRALADDLKAPAHEFTRGEDEDRRIRRFRWLAGLPSEGFFWPSPGRDSKS